MRLKSFLLFAIVSFALLNCSKGNGTSVGGIIPLVDTITNPPTVTNDTISYWITKADQSSLLVKQPTAKFSTTGTGINLTVDSATAYQTIDGFGYTLTGGSAYLINLLGATTKSNLLQELFGNGSASIGVSYLRISMGASDLDASVFSYDDVANDTALTHFSLLPDEKDLIPLLKSIIAINPNIKIIATPWSAPTWMKDNNKTVGGSLKPVFNTAYANYFVKYIQAMKADGIIIDAITPQNEPLNPANNPSMYMDATAQLNFIQNNLGPAFKAAAITTKIICYDHNCDRPDYPQKVLTNDATNKYIDGAAFHLYAGDISALTSVHNNFPSKNIYFTEQYTSSTRDFGGDFLWHMKNVMIGSMNNWSKNALEWNLANDPNYQPHTPGGCDVCKGALTLTNTVSRNVGYYIIAQVSKFVPADSKRVSSAPVNGLYNVAFVTPQGKKVLVVLNDGASSASFNIQYKNRYFATSVAGGSAITYVW